MTTEKLTDRETEVLWLIAEGLSNKLIADRLGITDHTAKFHVANAVKKHKTGCRTHAVVLFILDNLEEAKTRLRHPQLKLRLAA